VDVVKNPNHYPKFCEFCDSDRDKRFAPKGKDEFLTREVVKEEERSTAIEQ
jgi:hypothetical protein